MWLSLGVRESVSAGGVGEREKIKRCASVLMSNVECVLESVNERVQVSGCEREI